MKKNLLNALRAFAGLAVFASLVFSTFGAGVSAVSAQTSIDLAEGAKFDVLPPSSILSPGDVPATTIYTNDTINITLEVTDATSAPASYVINFCVLLAASVVPNTTCTSSPDYSVTVSANSTRADGNTFYLMHPEITTDGIYTVVVVLDANNSVTETNETNNWLSKNFTVENITSSSPANDNFANATDLTGVSLPYDVTEYDTNGATREANEPANFICDVAEYQELVASSVWYKITPAVNTALVVDTLQSSYDTVLAVWRGTSLGSLTKVECSDQYPIEDYPDGSLVAPYLTAGQTYYFQVGKYAGYTSPDIAAASVLESAALREMTLRAALIPESGMQHGDDGDLHFRVRQGVLISGNVGLPGVTVNYEVDSIAKTVTSDVNGNYRFIVPAGWNGTITPYKAGSTFTPASRTYTSVVLDTPNQNFVTTPVFSSSATQDGWTLESTEFSNKGGSANYKLSTFTLGDSALRQQYRSIVSFRTSSLPDTASITSVMLKIKVNKFTGGFNPVAKFNGFMVDVKKGFFGKSSLIKTDFEAKQTKRIGPFKPTPLGGWYTLNLTTAKTAVNLKGYTQIRLFLNLDDNNNTTANTILFYSGNHSNAAYRPQLIINYSVP